MDSAKLGLLTTLVLGIFIYKNVSIEKTQEDDEKTF